MKLQQPSLEVAPTTLYLVYSFHAGLYVFATLPKVDFSVSFSFLAIYIGRQWRNFVPYLCQVIVTAIL